jgi:hypothetical protein
VIEFIDAMDPGDFLAAILAVSWGLDRWLR